jgi:adenine-specific DNA-methyltransferase
VTGIDRIIFGVFSTRVFGSESFRNEIVWKRRGGILAQSKQYGAATDTVLFYSKGNEYFFEAPLIKEGQEDYVEERFSNFDKDGRRYRLSPLLSPSYSPTLVYEYKGAQSPPNGWSVSPETMKRLDAEGRLVFPEKPNGRIQRKQYLDEWKGSPIQNLWVDIPPVNPVASERLDYPTQKPERLLERIITASCPSGGLVFDCFMGSGTTQAVAMKLGRRFIGADINLGAIQTTTKRLIGVADALRQKGLDGEIRHFTGFELHNVNHYDVFRNPKDGRMVKIMPVNRISTRADLNELIAGFDYKAWERRQKENPNRPVEKITLVCMGHEPDLAPQLELAVKPFKIDVEVVDILRDKADLEFKRDSQAKVSIKKGELIIAKFYPMNLLQKLSLHKESVEDWKELVESVLIDWNYDGAVLQPAMVDIPGRGELVKGVYRVPDDAGTIRVKITDVLSESWEGSVGNGD